MENIEIMKKCPFCGGTNVITCPIEGYNKWTEGEFIQNAFPDMPAEIREMLISGICPACWEETFRE